MSATRGQPLPTAAAGPPPRWPLPLSIVILASGLALVVLETSSLLFFAGLALAGAGAYGIARRSGRARSPSSTVSVP